MKAYARSEWDMLNAADSMQVEGASSRALAYIKAATVLYPQSSDAQVCLGTALAKRGRQGGRHADKYFAAARLAFAAAQKNPVSFTFAYIEQEIAKLPAR